MASPDEAIYGRLINTGGVTSICGTRIYPDDIPQNSHLPAITYSLMSDAHYHAFGRDANIASPRYEVTAWSTSFSQSRSLAKQVRYALQDYRGSTWCNIQTVFFEDQHGMIDIDPDSKRVVYHVTQEYIVWHST